MILIPNYRQAKLPISKDQHQPIALDLKYPNQIFKMRNLFARYVGRLSVSLFQYTLKYSLDHNQVYSCGTVWPCKRVKFHLKQCEKQLFMVVVRKLPLYIQIVAVRNSYFAMFMLSNLGKA